MRWGGKGKVLLLGLAALIVASAALWWLRGNSGPTAADPFEMGSRCAWYDPEKLALQWTYYFVTDDGALVYVGFAGRLHDSSGKPFAGINLVVLEENREVINLWQRYPAGDLVIRDTDLDVSLGANAIGKRRVDGRERYTCHLELNDRGRAIVLDAAVEQTVKTCRKGGFNLLSHEELGNYFEYEVPCPRGRLSGSLTVDGKKEELRGTGYLESIRWLKSQLEHPARWYWGYAYADPYTVLFFKPGDYPNARTLLTLHRDGECAAVVEDGDLRVSPPDRDNGAFALIYGEEDLDVALRVDSRARRSRDFPIYIAPFELDLRHGQLRHSHRGSMVFEIGEWRSF